MSPNPDPFLQHLREQGYHSRSNKHSNALAEAIVADLLAACPVLARLAGRGQVVYDLNFTINAGTSDWNVDLVLGAPPPGTDAPSSNAAILCTRPSTVQIAVELKSGMTEHRKQIRNRKRDLEAHHEHVHRYSNRTIAGGVLVVNGSATLQSPLRPEVTTHSDPGRLVEHCVLQVRSIAARSGLQGQGLDAKCVIVVDMDNIDHAGTRFITRAPAPRVGDPLHYDAFIQALCTLYRERFANAS
jgi:hypothetical protein